MLVLTAFNRSIRAANHLTDEHAAVVEAARTLARRLDEKNPNDNVSHSVFLKYLVELRLVPEGVEAPKDGSKLAELQAAVAPLRAVP